MERRSLRPLFWVRSAKRDFMAFPSRVQDSFGFQLYLAQAGQHPPSAKPLKGMGKATFELIDNFDGNTYRAVYTVRFAEAVYVVHAFQKKAKRGDKTPRKEIELIARRLKDAQSDYVEWFKKDA
jgi:phage-related protein